MLPSKKSYGQDSFEKQQTELVTQESEDKKAELGREVDPISKFKWLPQKSFPTLSLAEITCEPCQSALYSLGVADFV